MSEAIKKSPVIEQIVTHFENKKVRVIEVPEWGEDEHTPLKVYVRPLTVSQVAKLRKDIANLGELEALVHLVINKALDGRGKPLFNIDDKHWLMTKADDAVLQLLALRIRSGGVETDDLDRGTIAEK